MATLAEIRDGLADALAEIQVDDLTVTPYLWWNPTPPAIDVYPGDPFGEQRSFRNGSGAMFFTIRARVTTADHDAGEDLLLSLMEPRGSTSVTAALLADRRLGGLVDDLKVEGPSGYRTFPVPGGDGALLGSEWRAEILTTNGGT